MRKMHRIWRFTILEKNKLDVHTTDKQNGFDQEQSECD